MMSFCKILCMTEILWLVFTNKIKMLISSAGCSFMIWLPLRRCWSSCSWETTKILNLCFMISWVSCEFSTKDWIAKSTWDVSSGLLTKTTSNGFFDLLERVQSLKNSWFGSTSKEASNLSSFWTASPHPKSNCSNPVLAKLPPRVTVQTIVYQIEEMK